MHAVEILLLPQPLLWVEIRLPNERTPPVPSKKHIIFPQPLSLQNQREHFGVNLQIGSHHHFSLPL